MSKTLKWIFAFLRIAFGWLFFYSGITKVLDPEWTSAGLLTNASTFPEFYAYLADPQILVIVDFLNAWGQTLIGAGLIAGVLVPYAAAAGILLMILYYFPSLEFPRIGSGYIVDSHIIYAFALMLFVAYKDTHLLSLGPAISKFFKRK